MARRSSEQIRAEIDRLAGLVEIFEDFNRRYHSPDFDEVVPLPGKDTWIAACRAGGASWSQILAGYEQAVNETLAAFVGNAPDKRAYAKALLADFEGRTGQPLFSVVSPPKRALSAIAKRGRIQSETEYYMVKESLDDLADDPKTSPLAHQLTECLATFEQAVRGE